MKVYYDKEKALNKELYCLGIDLPNTKLQTLDYVVYEDNNLFTGYPIVENDVLRQATLKELIDLGEVKLKDGEVFDLENDKINFVQAPTRFHIWKDNNWVLYEENLSDGYVVVKDEKGERLEFLSPSDNLIIPKWNKESKSWEESADLQEQLDYWTEQLYEIESKALVSKGLGLPLTQEQTEYKEECLKKHKQVSKEIAFNLNKEYDEY